MRRLGAKGTSSLVVRRDRKVPVGHRVKPLLSSRKERVVTKETPLVCVRFVRGKGDKSLESPTNQEGIRYKNSRNWAREKAE